MPQSIAQGRLSLQKMLHDSTPLGPLSLSVIDHLPPERSPEWQHRPAREERFKHQDARNWTTPTQLPQNTSRDVHARCAYTTATRATNRRRKFRQGWTLRRHKFLPNRTPTPASNEHGARSLTRPATTRKPRDDSRQQHGTTQSATASGEDAQHGRRRPTDRNGERQTSTAKAESGKQNAQSGGDSE
jgi:hypothetical protein